MHLAATYMLCRSINHGINLDKQVSLQYLYYLDQVSLQDRFALACRFFKTLILLAHANRLV